MTTTSIIGTTSDRIRGNHAVYATARATSVSNDNVPQLGQVLTGGVYYIDRVALKFDTSSIPASDIISQVNLRMVAVTDSSATDFDVDIVKYNWSASDPIAAGNRETVYDGILAASPDENIWRNTNGMAINTQYTSGNLDISWINKGGSTYYGLLSNRDRDGAGTAPSGAEAIVLASVGHATSSYRPTLIIIHSPSAGGIGISPYMIF